MPVSKSHLSSGESGKAQLHAVKAVETGVINVRRVYSPLPFRSSRQLTATDDPDGARVRIQTK